MSEALFYYFWENGVTDTLQLNNVGMEADSCSLIKVNSMYQTADRHKRFQLFHQRQDNEIQHTAIAIKPLQQQLTGL